MGSPKMSVYDNQEPKFRFIEECAIPGCRNPANQLDHALFSGAKGNSRRQTKRWREFLDSDYNMRPTCMECNVAKRTADTYWSRRDHVHKWLKKDAEGFQAWLASYPGKASSERLHEIGIMVAAILSVKEK